MKNQMIRRLSLSFVLLVGAMLLSADALAAGYFLPIHGVRPLGRAGASVVSGGGPHAVWYNPAALAGESDTRILLDLGLSDLDVQFDRTSRLEQNGDLTVYGSVTNDYGPGVIPNLIVVSDFGVEGLAIGGGVLAPYGGLYDYELSGPQRYSAVRNAESLFLWFDLSAAYEVTDWFRIGASFQSMLIDTTIYGTASAYPGIFGQPEDPDLDILMEIHTSDAFVPTGNFGVWFQIIEGLELGLSGQLPAKIWDDDATLAVRLPTHPYFDSAQVQGERVEGGFDIAGAIRGGVRWVHSRGDVELDVTWENWSVHNAIVTRPDDLVITGLFSVDELAIGPLTIDMEWQNTIAVNLGSDFVVFPNRLIARAGLLYEQGAIPEERISLFQLDLDKIAPSIGLTVEIPEAHMMVDVGYTHVFYLDQTVTNSAVEQINPSFEEGAIIVGNGSYSGNIDVFGIGAQATF